MNIDNDYDYQFLDNDYDNKNSQVLAMQDKR